MSLGITYSTQDKSSPTPDKIMQLDAGDCVKSTVYQRHPASSDCIYPGDILVVKKVYKFHIIAAIPAGMEFTLGVNDFQLIFDKNKVYYKNKVSAGDFVVTTYNVELYDSGLNPGQILEVVATLDSGSLIVENDRGSRYILRKNDYLSMAESRRIAASQLITSANESSQDINESLIPLRFDDNIIKEENTMSMQNELNKMFGAISPGMCRLSMNGGIAVKTSSGYKTYNVKTGRLTNCDSFAFDLGTEWFFCLPTNHVRTGDIVLINGKPCCVKKATKDEFTVINYETNRLETVLPERHMFMGNMYFYSKIVSPFGNPGKKEGGMKRLMKYMMMSEMMKGGMANMMGGSAVGANGQAQSNGMNPMMFAMMMGGGGFGDFFEGIFEDEDDEDGFDGMFGQFFNGEEDDEDGEEGDEDDEPDTPAPKTPRKSGGSRKGSKGGNKKDKEEENQ